jgi:hypothetical protein
MMTEKKKGFGKVVRGVAGLAIGIGMFGCCMTYPLIANYVVNSPPVYNMLHTPVPTDVVISIDNPSLFLSKPKQTPTDVATAIETAVPVGTAVIPETPVPTATLEQLVNAKPAIPLTVRLSQTIPRSATPLNEIELTSWEMSTFEHLLPLVSTIEEAANYYGVDPLFSVQIGVQESSLNPLATSKTNDYGLFQLKVNSMKNYFYNLRLDPASEFYAPFLEENPNLTQDFQVFDPTVNTWVHFMVMRNQWRNVRVHQEAIQGGFPLTTNSQMYAYYWGGQATINIDGTLTRRGQAVADAANKRYFYINKAVPLLGLDSLEIMQLTDTTTRDLLLLFVNPLSGQLEFPTPKEGYAKILDYNLNDLKARDLAHEWITSREILMYYNSVQFARNMSLIYGVNEDDNYKALDKMGKTMIKALDNADPELRIMVQEAYDSIPRQ